MERRRISMINFNTKPKPEKEEKPNRSTSSIGFGASQKQSDEEAKRAIQIDAMKKAKDAEHQREIEFMKSMNTKVLTGAKPKGIFHTQADSTADDITKSIVATFPQFAGDVLSIKAMIKTLNGNDLTVVTGWAEEFIIEQKNLVTSAMNRIKEFNSLNGTELLQEVLEYGKQSSHNTGFFQRLTSKFSNTEGYVTKITALKQHVSGILPVLCSYKDKCKASKLALYLAILSAVDDSNANKDKLIAEAFYNRRMLLNGALTNLKMLDTQLEQTLELITNMLNEISHIMDVVLPALKLKG